MLTLMLTLPREPRYHTPDDYSPRLTRANNTYLLITFAYYAIFHATRCYAAIVDYALRAIFFFMPYAMPC